MGSVVKPEFIWRVSSLLHSRGVPFIPRLLKSIIFIFFHAILPYECVVPRDIRLVHRGLGTVVHPKTVFGDNVRLGHGVTIAAGSQVADDGLAVTVEDDVFIGTGSVIIPRSGGKIRIGKGAVVGANALVVGDIPVGGRAFSPRADVG
jgi:serine O-acetyltransferase